MSEREDEPGAGVFDHEVAEQPSVAEAQRPPDIPKIVADPEPAQASAPEPETPPTAAQPAPAASEAEPPPSEAPAAPAETSTPPPPPEPEPVTRVAPVHAEGSLAIPPGLRVFSGPPNGARRSVGIAVSKFNGEITSRLLEGALEELAAAGVAPEAIEIMPVPGAFELPLAAMALAKSRRYSCVLALGCVIRGETPHFEFVSSEAASGVQLAGLETGVPVSFGVLTCDTTGQARERAGGARGNKGVEAARSALEMVESLGLLRATVQA